MATIKIVSNNGNIVFELDAPLDEDQIKVIIADIGFTLHEDKSSQPKLKG